MATATLSEWLPLAGFDISLETELTRKPFHAAMPHAADLAIGQILHGLGGLDGTVAEAMRYAVTGGKGLRAFLVIESARLHGVREAQAAPAAGAIEALHAYSLVHDDMPCMDDDALRRGQPTVHVKWDEATAVLAGDCLHALAFDILTQPDTSTDPFTRAELVATLARASGHEGMAGGQMMDIVSAEQSYDLRQVTRLQQLKTGALLAASVEMGAVLGRVPPEGRTHLRAYARDIGLAFQIADDLLDVEGDEAKAGKALRKDDEQGKQTFVTLMGVEQARAQATMLVEQAGHHLAGHGEDARLLVELAHFIVKRDH